MVNLDIAGFKQAINIYGLQRIGTNALFLVHGGVNAFALLLAVKLPFLEIAAFEFAAGVVFGIEGGAVFFVAVAEFLLRLFDVAAFVKGF